MVYVQAQSISTPFQRINDLRLKLANIRTVSFYLRTIP